MDKQYLPELIVGKRISLKRHNISLAQKMFEYVTEDEKRLSRFLPWPKFINKVEDEIDFINKCNDLWEKNGAADYGIFRNEDNEYIGNISSFALSWANESCEIGYWILGKFEGHGYISEAVVALEEVLFKIGFNRIVIRFDPLNNKSGSIPKRLNYIYEGTLRESIKVNERFRDLEVYSKIRSDISN
ncbi:MAG: GNAT family protein [Bacteriovorax sp.]|nr:GNAT family protein [Bacteriovorax sp.]